MRAPRQLVDAGFRALNLVHRTLLRATGARVGSSAFGLTFVQLHTVGRRTGLTRTVLLVAPVIDDDTFVLVASKGGDDRDPEWFKNLLARPDVELTLGTDRRPVRARVATAEEAARLWPRVIDVYKPYASYRRRTSREIPLVICEPR